MRTTEVSVIADMRDWLLIAGDACNFLDYCGYGATDVLSAMEDMYPNGVIGWFADYTQREVYP